MTTQTPRRRLRSLLTRATRPNTQHPTPATPPPPPTHDLPTLTTLAAAAKQLLHYDAHCPACNTTHAWGQAPNQPPQPLCPALADRAAS